MSWRRPASLGDQDKAHTKFRELVWAVTERLQPADGTARFFELYGRLTFLYGTLDMNLRYEGNNGWRVQFGRGFGERRMRSPALDKLTVDAFVAMLTDLVREGDRRVEQDRVNRERRDREADSYKTLQERAAEALGFPLRTERSYYNKLAFSAVEIDGEVRLNADIQWRGLTVEQAIALKELLSPEPAEARS